MFSTRGRYHAGMSMGVLVGLISISVDVLLTFGFGLAAWFLRRAVRRYDKIGDNVEKLLRDAAVDERTMPNLLAQVRETDERSARNEQQIAVLSDWRAGHERWHERRGIPTPD